MANQIQFPMLDEMPLFQDPASYIMNQAPMPSPTMPNPHHHQQQQQRQQYHGSASLQPQATNMIPQSPQQLPETPQTVYQLSPSRFSAQSVASSPQFGGVAMAQQGAISPNGSTTTTTTVKSPFNSAVNWAPLFQPPPPSPHMSVMNYLPDQSPPQPRPQSQSRPKSKSADRGLLEPVLTKKEASKTTKPPKLSQPLHELLPPVADCGQKPTLSYAQLIASAISRSPQGKLTLAQIYKWIMENFSYYRTQAEGGAGWQNSIRHNLSLHQCFAKVERPKNDPGKGHYWTILPGTEAHLVKDKPVRKTSAAAENVPVMSARPEAPASSDATAPPSSSDKTKTPDSPKRPLTPHSLPSLPSSSQASQQQMPAPEPSTDATIPASEPAGFGADPVTAAAHHHEQLATGDPAGGLQALSPAPPSVHSSPPAPREARPGYRTTPPAPRAALSRKRAYSLMEDSGYISSLEFSATRLGQTSAFLTSEADRPRKRKSTRAEDEISRMRSSVCGSPTKSRSRNTLPPTSSPTRSRNPTGFMGPPSTPVVKPRPIQRAPPSVSPHTNLRIHREQVSAMLQSPCGRMPMLEEGDVAPYSPAFSLDHYPTLDTSGGFEIFQDNKPETPLRGSAAYAPLDFGSLNASPLSRPTRRGVLQRAQSASALADITAAGENRNPLGAFTLQYPVPGAPYDFSPTKFGEFIDFGSSPTKGPGLTCTPNKTMGNYMGNHMGNPPLAAEAGAVGGELFSSPGFDITKGFASIGARAVTNLQMPSTSRKLKATLERSRSNIY